MHFLTSPVLFLHRFIHLKCMVELIATETEPDKVFGYLLKPKTKTSFNWPTTPKQFIRFQFLLQKI